VRLAALLFIVACVPGPALGQSTAVIEGRVLDADSNAPLPRPPVFVVESMHGTVTDSSGRFRLEGVRPGPKRPYVSRVGHERPLHIDPSGEIAVPYEATLYQHFAFTARMARRRPRKHEPPGEHGPSAGPEGIFVVLHLRGPTGEHDRHDVETGRSSFGLMLVKVASGHVL